jgi:hypothetical protein
LAPKASPALTCPALTCSRAVVSCRGLSCAPANCRPTVHPAPDLGARPQVKATRCQQAQAAYLLVRAGSSTCVLQQSVVVRSAIGTVFDWDCRALVAGCTYEDTFEGGTCPCVRVCKRVSVSGSVSLPVGLMSQACNVLDLYSQTQHTKTCPHSCPRLSPTP